MKVKIDGAPIRNEDALVDVRKSLQEVPSCPKSQAQRKGLRVPSWRFFGSKKVRGRSASYWNMNHNAAADEAHAALLCVSFSVLRLRRENMDLMTGFLRPEGRRSEPCPSTFRGETASGRGLTKIVGHAVRHNSCGLRSPLLASSDLSYSRNNVSPSQCCRRV